MFFNLTAYRIAYLLLGVLISPPLFSAPDPRLWLPVSYQKHYERLVLASKKVEELEDCYHLLKGDLVESQARQGNIVFSFRCRDSSRKMFTVQVMSKDLTILRVEDIWRQQEEKQQAADKERKLRELLANRDQYWAVCLEEFEKQTRTFNEAKIVTPLPPKPDITKTGGFIYLIEFQTLSLKKNSLSYLATAEIEHLRACSVAIRPM